MQADDILMQELLGVIAYYAKFFVLFCIKSCTFAARFHHQGL